MTGRPGCIFRVTLAAAVLLIAGCGGDPAAPEVPPRETAGDSNPATAPVRPLTVFDTDGAPAITPVLEAWRAGGGGPYAITAGDYRTPFPEDADVLVAGSLAKLWAFAEGDKLRPVRSAAIDERIGQLFRDPESRWVGLSYRARIVVYNPGLVSEQALQSIGSYASLGDEQWRDRLCLSSSRVDGNALLVAWLIRRHGEREAELIVRRWRENLPDGRVEASDAAVIRKIDQGECALGLVDTDQEAALQQSPRIRPHWFDAPDATMVDITGAGISRHAARPDEARAFLEWLTTAQASAFLAASRTEFPASDSAPTGNALAAWSANVRPTVPLADLGFLLADAERLIERARYP